MSTNDQNQDNGQDERRAARLTAHALGQVDSAERAEVEAELAVNPEMMKTIREERAFATELRRALDEAPTPERSAELREAVERRLKELEKTPPAAPPAVPTRQPRWGRRLWSLLAVAAALLVLAVPTYFYIASRGGNQPNRKIAATYAISKPAPQAHGKRVAGEVKGDAGDLDLDETPEEPTEATTETLTMEPPAAQGQTEEYNDESKVFEHRGRGTARPAKDPRVDGLGGFSTPTPVPQGKVGTATPGAGGAGLGSGGRGSGLRVAQPQGERRNGARRGLRPGKTSHPDRRADVGVAPSRRRTRPRGHRRQVRRPGCHRATASYYPRGGVRGPAGCPARVGERLEHRRPRQRALAGATRRYRQAQAIGPNQPNGNGPDVPARG